MHTSLKKATILIIDDFQGMRTMLRDLVRSMGVTKVDTASNGKEAISMLGNHRYDIVICDYNLGEGQNGQQVLEEAKLRSLIGVSTIWVMVTAEKTHDMVMGAAEVKPDDYLLKPVNQALLEGRLEKQIARKQSLGPIEAAIKAQNYPEAIAQCDQQIKAKVLNPQEILRIKSDLLLTMGDYNGAADLFESVLAQRSVPWAKTGLGRIHFQAQRYENAKNLFQQVLAENPMYMEASDWLAKTWLVLGDAAQAQQVLQNAVQVSPNSPIRQKLLGDTAYQNGALAVAQAAFEKTIKISEFSSHKNASVYAGLAKVLSDSDAPQDALRVLAQSKRDFKHNPEAALQAAAAEGVVYQKLGQSDKAEAAMAEAANLMGQLSGQMSVEVAMDVAKSYFKLGKKDEACTLLRDVVKNNHENAALSKSVEAVFEGANLASEGQAMIAQSRQEVIAVNNEGVLLAKNGDFKGGVNLLRAAAQKLPNSETILINLCGLLIGLMNKEGKSEALLQETRELLERVRHLNGANKKLPAYADALARMGGGK